MQGESVSLKGYHFRSRWEMENEEAGTIHTHTHTSANRQYRCKSNRECCCFFCASSDPFKRMQPARKPFGSLSTCLYTVDQPRSHLWRVPPPSPRVGLFQFSQEAKKVDRHINLRRKLTFHRQHRLLHRKISIGCRSMSSKLQIRFEIK